MPGNMSVLDRRARLAVALVAVALAIAVGAGTVAGIALFAVAAALLATSASGFCPLYRLVRLDSRGRRPLPR